MTQAYLVALLSVAIGACLATLLRRLAAGGRGPGSDPPAHAWLNLFGFVSLVIVRPFVARSGSVG